MTPTGLAAIRARDAVWKPDADLMDVFGACYGCEFDRRALLAMLDAVTRERDALQVRVDRALDFVHHTSCGHVWTMRATACPECFDVMRARLREVCAAATPAFDTEDNRRALDAVIQRARKALGGESE